MTKVIGESVGRGFSRDCGLIRCCVVPRNVLTELGIAA